MANGPCAAATLANDLTLATRNAKDFAPLGLRLFDPWQDRDEAN